jgi:hypothetical protein
MPRPAGEIRQALASAAERLAQEVDGVTWRDLAAAAQVGCLAARRTVENMARAGDLEVIGSTKRAHSRRWMKLYAPAPKRESNFATSSTSALDGVVRGWRG